ncbi:MAG: alginate export family protein, partial [Saprospiraceae bacterium]
MRTFEKPTKILLSLATFMCLHFWLQAQFTLSAELRPRVEIRHGYKTLANTASETAGFISQRSRLNFEYARKKYEIKLSLQDVRVWGDEPHLKDVPSSVLHEAWGELHFNDKLSLRAGRQELVYDDHRLFGNVNWTQQARSHDAAVLKLENNGWKAHFGAAYNNMGESLFKTSYTLNN